MSEPTGTAGKVPDKSFFSGPPSNKVTAGTLGTAVATLFWVIAARTFWKSITAEDVTLYVSATAVVLTMVFGFVLPESAAFTKHSAKRLGLRCSESSPSEHLSHPTMASLDIKMEAAIKDLEKRMTVVEHYHPNGNHKGSGIAPD